MDWIKRNLVFVIGAAIALVLLGLAGWYNYSGYDNNSVENGKLVTAFEELKRLKALKPAPGEGKVDNIKNAKEQQKEAQQFIAKLAKRLEHIPAFPEGTNVLSKDYSLALQQTIVELQREATNSSVVLPPNYKFSFFAQASRMTYTGSLDPLASQLGEVRVICNILNKAKINTLDAIRRQRVSPDDSAGPASDYTDLPATTNELAVLTPYEVVFRCFTPELAAVLEGFATSPYGLIVKGVNVELAPVTAGEPTVATPAPQVIYAQQPVPPPRGDDSRAAFNARYGGANRIPPPVQPVPQPVFVAAPKPSLQPFLQQKQLKVTMLIHVVKLLPKA